MIYYYNRILVRCVLCVCVEGWGYILKTEGSYVKALVLYRTISYLNRSLRGEKVIYDGERL